MTIDIGSNQCPLSPQSMPTIGLPVCNGAQYLEESFASVLEQSFRNFELIISDNASTDATESIAREFAGRDSRVKYVRQSFNVGGAKNFNLVVGMASAPLFKWVADDDVILPGFLEACMDAFSEASAEVILCYARSYLIAANGDVRPYDGDLDLRQELEHERLRSFLDNYEFINLLFGVMRTNLLRRTNLIRPYLSPDRVLLAEMALVCQRRLKTARFASVEFCAV